MAAFNSGTCTQGGRRGLLVSPGLLETLRQEAMSRMGLHLPSLEELPAALRNLAFRAIDSVPIPDTAAYWKLHNTIQKANKNVKQTVQLEAAQRVLEEAQEAVRCRSQLSCDAFNQAAVHAAAVHTLLALYETPPFGTENLVL